MSTAVSDLVQEKERNRLAREAARKRTNNEKKHAKETEKAQKDVLRKLDQRRAKVMGDGVVEDTVLEWEAAMGPAIDRAAVSAGVAPAKLR